MRGLDNTCTREAWTFYSKQRGCTYVIKKWALAVCGILVVIYAAGLGAERPQPCAARLLSMTYTSLVPSSVDDGSRPGGLIMS